MTIDAAPSLDRHGLIVLDTEECWSLLRAAPIGRLAFVNAGEALILPINFAVEGHHLFFRSARGAKFAAAALQRPVSLEIDAWDVQEQSGWSVLLTGTADLVLDLEEEARLDGLGLRSWAPGVGAHDWVRILPNEISGRRIPS